MWFLSFGALFGISLGANDGGNLFGTAVATRVIRFRTAAILAAVFVILGASLQGHHAIRTVQTITISAPSAVIIVVLCSAFTVALMTFLRLPISATQALIGAVIAVTIVTGTASAPEAYQIQRIIAKILLCWFLTPIGAALAALLLYYFIGTILNWLPMSILTRDNLILLGLVVVGTYCSYAFGANNTANVVGIYRDLISPAVPDTLLAAVGGFTIALGIIFFGKGLMLTIGAGLIRLDGFAALIVVLAEALTLHIFGILGVPVSASQAVVGAVLGIGLIRGAESIHLNVLKNIIIAWFMTPLLSFILAAAATGLFLRI
jgi:PiT family inorganic phosphate transporter